MGKVLMVMAFVLITTETEEENSVGVKTTMNNPSMMAAIAVAVFPHSNPQYSSTLQEN